MRRRPAPATTWQQAIERELVSLGRSGLDVDEVAELVAARDPGIAGVPRERWPLGAAQQPVRWGIAVAVAANILSASASPALPLCGQSSAPNPTTKPRGIQ